MKSKYISPFTDFGFKKLFGEEASKPLLVDFMNSLLPEKNQIKELSFRNLEQLGTIDSARKAIFDIYCENNKGEKFIIELQKAKQNYFKERTIFYSTFPISSQAEKGDWNFNLKAVFCVGILDFTFDDYTTESERKEVIHTVKLKDQNGRLFYDKLTYIYLEMPNFTLQEHELNTRLKKWLYFIKHLEDFQTIPSSFKDEVVFIEAFRKAELAKLEPAELENYENSLKIYRDLKNVIDTARDEGEEKGIEKGIGIGETKKTIEMAVKLKKKGSPVEFIKEITGLSEEEINNL